MQKREVDVAIIGAGTAGLNAAREAEKAGKSYVLIEAGAYGTTCARVGCMPSKLLIAAADVAHTVETAVKFGIDVDPDGWRVDGAAVMERVRRERDRFVDGVVRSTQRIDESKRMRGFARFTAPDTLHVDEQAEVKFQAAVVATGSSIRIPPQLAEIATDVLTNDTIFELEELPRSMAVFGTGIIGLEIGQALSRLGVHVCFFNPYEELGFVQDPRVTEVACDILCRDLRLNLGVEIHGVEREPGCYCVEWTNKAGERLRDRYDTVFSAAGRIPNVSGIGLENAGAVLDDRGRPRDWCAHTCQIGETRLFLAGDATGYRPILHEASDEGRIAGANAARWPDVQRGRRRVNLGIAFTQPNMAIVGARFKELREGEFVVGEVDFERQGRARVMGENRGILRVYADLDCTLVGAEMFAPRGEHLAQLLAWAAQSKLTIHDMLALPVYHPTVEEGMRTALRDAGDKLKISGRCAPEDRAYGPGD